jgi:RNA polymerase sigma-70 factor (ECF subfamily)
VALTQEQLTPKVGKHEQRAAFADVYSRHHAVVHGYLRARLLNGTDAEDLAQEAFLRAFGAMHRFDPATDIRPWLIGIARNVLREHVRRIRKRKEVTWTELCLELEETIEAEGTYEDVLHLLPVCTLKLGESARQAIQWHYLGGQKLQEIAQKLDKTVGAVKVLMVRARQALKRCIHSHTTGDGS